MRFSNGLLAERKFLVIRCDFMAEVIHRVLLWGNRTA